MVAVLLFYEKFNLKLIFKVNYFANAKQVNEPINPYP